MQRGSESVAVSVGELGDIFICRVHLYTYTPIHLYSGSEEWGEYLVLAGVARVLVVSRHGFSPCGCLETLLQVGEALHEVRGEREEDGRWKIREMCQK